MPWPRSASGCWKRFRISKRPCELPKLSRFRPTSGRPSTSRSNTRMNTPSTTATSTAPTRSLRCRWTRYREVTNEFTVAHSTTKWSKWHRDSYFAGALARVNNNFDQLLPQAQADGRGSRLEGALLQSLHEQCGSGRGGRALRLQQRPHAG